MSPASSEGSLYKVFAQVPDPRHRRGTIDPLPAILTLVATALRRHAAKPREAMRLVMNFAPS